MRPLTIPLLAGVLLALSASVPATSLQLPGSATLPAAELDLLSVLPAPAGAAADQLFNSGFETVAQVWHTSHYDDLPEQFAGTSFDYNGVHYRDLNMVSGFWLGDQTPFNPGPIAEGGLGNQFIIEDAGLLFDDFPEFGSAPNVLNPGDLYFFNPGPNLSLGALASLWMDLHQPAYGVNVEVVYYENGPWHGVEVTLQGYFEGEPVAATSFQLLSDDLDGRDNIGFRTLSLPGDTAIDQLHLHSRRISDGTYTAPRIMLDNLALGRWLEVDTTLSTYDDLPEQFAGTSFQHNGVSYRDLNQVSGYWPGDGFDPFGPGAVEDGGLGNQFVIEDAGLLFEDFPEFGSAPNVLNPGDLYFFNPGPNFSLGALASLWMDLDAPALGAAVDLVYYENGPWGGIEVSLQAYRNGQPVAATSFEITSDDPDGRDSIGYRTVNLEAGVPFDSLHLASRRLSDGAYTAPRIMLDNLRLQQLGSP
ncbi:MAG: hypothetical protein M0Q42_05790 [Xanthomonadales bacterium]|nr:hypothetical protein [Xanthomonadales bacterium]